MTKFLQSLEKQTTALIAIGLLVALFALLLLVRPAHAQEITPAADTYSFGSTSEFSPYVTLNTSTATLASTGADQTAGYIVVFSAAAGAGALLYIALRTKKINHHA